jgi:hypothetical protein
MDLYARLRHFTVISRPLPTITVLVKANKGDGMVRRIRTMALTVAGLAALALGGAAISGAASNGTAAKSKAAVQTTKHVKKHAAVKTRAHKVHAANAATTTTDGDNVQEGDQTGPETPDANEAPDTGTEAPDTGTEAPDANDGPGGHADEANGTPNADTQQSGQF